MIGPVKTILTIARDSVLAFIDDGCLSMAAALAFYTLFALPPLLFVLLNVLTWVLGLVYSNAPDLAAEAIVGQISQLIGSESATAEIERMMTATGKLSGSLWKSLLGLFGVFIGATGVLSALQEALNRVWKVVPDPDRTARQTIKAFALKRFLSFGMILGLGFLLLVSFAVTTILAMVVNALSIAGWFAVAMNYVLSFGVLVFFFAVVYRIMPDARIDKRETLIGAAITATLFMLGQAALQVYLQSDAAVARLGSATASLAVLLLWVYYSSTIVLFGAECTQILAERLGKGVRPEAGAVRIMKKVVRPKKS